MAHNRREFRNLIENFTNLKEELLKNGNQVIMSEEQKKVRSERINKL